VACPCLSPEGYRNLKWHRNHPEGAANPAINFPPWNGINPGLCNELGEQNAVIIDVAVKGFVQPVQSGATRRLTTEYVIELFGQVQTDDHVGMFPLVYGGTPLNFREWSQGGEDYILFDGRRYMVVNSNKIPDPSGGDFHHWETGLRLLKTERANAA
jgi:hypothetical protein